MTGAGLTGRLLVSGRVAARFSRWSFVCEFDAIGVDARTKIHAEAVAIDRYWVTQSPAVVELDLGDNLWSWPVRAHMLRDRSLTIGVEGAPTITARAI